jgi:hypothetical protein
VSETRTKSGDPDCDILWLQLVRTRKSRDSTRTWPHTFPFKSLQILPLLIILLFGGGRGGVGGGGGGGDGGGGGGGVAV